MAKKKNRSLAALVTKGKGVQWIPNPLNLKEAAKLLNSKNLGVLDIQLSAYMWCVLCWDQDEPDTKDDLGIGIVYRRYNNNETVINKRRCLLCGILQSEVNGVNNCISHGSRVIVYNTQPHEYSDYDDK